MTMECRHFCSTTYLVCKLGDVQLALPAAVETNIRHSVLDRLDKITQLSNPDSGLQHVLHFKSC